MPRRSTVLRWLLVLAIGLSCGLGVGVALPIPGAGGVHGTASLRPGQVPPAVGDHRDPTQTGHRGPRQTPNDIVVAQPGDQPGNTRKVAGVQLSDEQTLALPTIPSELRRRLKEALTLGTTANAGDSSAQQQRDQRRASEPDPRVRHALATGKLPSLGEARQGAPTLPMPAKQAEAGTTDGYWLTPDKDGTYKSRITVDADGHATVDTTLEGKQYGDWHVRYNGWAWRDASGKLIIDGRGQPVKLLKTPGWGGWSPDSMIIGPTGLIDLIDDKHDTGQGATQREGNG
ncbi:MAG: hypothetical protein AAB263_15210 [Planctomycetota bacterium]